MQSRLYNAIGLCQKAGKAQSGAFAAEQAIKSGRAKIVLLETGASEATGGDLKLTIQNQSTSGSDSTMISLVLFRISSLRVITPLFPVGPPNA